MNWEDHRINRIKRDLHNRNIKCTPQVINVLTELVDNYISPELIGDSDTLLYGLLLTGSYTIDALVDSGVDVDYLERLASNSTYSYRYSDGYPIKELFEGSNTFASLLNRFMNSNEVMESADILEAAINPSPTELPTFQFLTFPKQHTCHTDSRILKSVEIQVSCIIEYCLDILTNYCNFDVRSKKSPLTKKETQILFDELSIELSDTETNWAITLTNQWLVSQTYNSDNTSLSISIANKCLENVSFGSSFFVESGGSFSKLALSLQIAKRYAPEREQPLLGLIEKEGRIYIKEFSYRSSVHLAESNDKDILSIKAPIPTPLISKNVLLEFEELINKNNLKEQSIQTFLTSHPEIIESLGYVTCQPQIILREKSSKLIPDFILHKPGNNGFDILDLKLPSAKISAQNPYLRISHEITKAFAQLRMYKNYFNNPVNTSKFYKTFGLDVFNPELIVIIGRRTELLPAKRLEIQQQAPDIRILSYDELIDYAKIRLIYP